MRPLTPAVRRRLLVWHLAALLSALVPAAATAKWVRVGTALTFTLYVDPASLRVGARTTRLTILHDYLEAETIRPGLTYRSVKSEWDFDCAGRRQRILSSISYAGPMARGKIVDRLVQTGAWLEVPGGSSGDARLGLACKLPPPKWIE